MSGYHITYIMLNLCPYWPEGQILWPQVQPHNRWPQFHVVLALSLKYLGFVAS